MATFVARIAHNRGIDHTLARQRDPGGAPIAEDWPDPLPEPVQRVEANERQMRLVAAIRELPLGMRQVVTLALEGFSNIEIAGVLDIEPNAADARLSRARRRLRELLGDPS
jgi:RNA polymerase sigma-70 factor (ECF subfamily)